MRYIIVFFVLFFLNSCSEKGTNDFVILSHEMQTKNVAINVGDTIDINTSKIKLNKGESLLLNDLTKGLVIDLFGPLTINTQTIANTQFRTFNEKYFSVVKENLKNSETEIRRSVFGGSYRGSTISTRYLDGESLIMDKINFAVLMDAVKNTTIEVYLKDELIVECNDSMSCLTDFGKIREEDKSQEIKVEYVYNNLKTEKYFNLISSEASKNLLKEEEEIIKQGIPDEGLLGFYLQNKLFSKAKDHFKNEETKSNITKQLIKVLED